MNIDSQSVDIYRSFLQELAWDPIPTHQAFLTKYMQKVINEKVAPLHARPEFQLSNEDEIKEKISELKEKGITLLGQVLTADQAAAIRAASLEKKVFNSHVYQSSDRKPYSISELEGKSHLASYRLEDVVTFPHLLEIANRPDVLRIAEGYLGAVPTLYQMNLMWSFAGLKGTAKEAQTYHRDQESLRFCALFVYLTDVDENSGPHNFIENSHSYDFLRNIAFKAMSKGFAALLPERLRKHYLRKWRIEERTGELYYSNGYNKDDLFKKYLGSYVREITGPAGFAFLVNPFAVHKGTTPKLNDRLMFWARYGLYENYVNTKGVSEKCPIDLPSAAARLGDNDAIKYINRSIISI